MAWDDIIAAISGALTGGTQGWQYAQEQARQKKLDEERERERRAAEDDRRWQRLIQQQAADERTRDREQRDVSDMLTTLGQGAELSPDQMGRVDRSGLGYRMQASPDADLSHSLFLGSPFGLPDVPMPRGTVAPTAEERAAQQTRDAEQKRVATIAESLGDPYERQAFLADPKGYKLTGQSFMDSASRAKKAKEEADRKLKEEIDKEKALAPLRTAEAVNRTEGEERVRAKYKVPIPIAGENGQPSSLAQMIAEYRSPPPAPRQLATPSGAALMADVQKLNPAYDATQYATRQKMRVAYTSGPQSQTLGSLNTSIVHLDHLADVAQAMGNGTFQPGNAAYNWWTTLTGGSAPTNFEGARDILAGELAGAFKRSGATDVEIEKVSSSLKSKESPQQVNDYITGVAIPMLAGKAQISDEQYHAVMGAKDPWSAYTPSAKAVLGKWKRSAAAPAGVKSAGGAAASPGRTPAVAGEERTINGKRAVWDGQGWVEKK